MAFVLLRFEFMMVVFEYVHYNKIISIISIISKMFI